MNLLPACAAHCGAALFCLAPRYTLGLRVFQILLEVLVDTFELISS